MDVPGALHLAVAAFAARLADAFDLMRPAGGEAIVLLGDVRDVAVCARLVADTVAALGRIDVLVNNAGGVVDRHPIRDVPDDLYETIHMLNARSVFACSRPRCPPWRPRAAGPSSTPRRWLRGTVAVAVRCSTRAFVSTFTRGLAKEVARFNIRVNAVAPGVIDTPNKSWTTPQHAVTGRRL